MIGVAAALLLASQVEWPDAGDWEMARAEDRCLTRLTYEGPGSTELNVSIELDGSSAVLINNQNWSAREGVTYPEMEIVLDQWVYSGPGGLGYISSGYRPGFSMIMPVDFLETFAQAKSLKVYNGDTLVDSLDLEGSAAAVASLRRCLMAVQRQRAAEERERRRWEHIPTDPFSGAAPSDSQQGTNEPVQWRRVPPAVDFYPSRALERGVSGSATLTCVAAADGTPTGCSITSETPAGAGFGAEALRASRHGRLTLETVNRLAGQPFTFTLRFDIAAPSAEGSAPASAR